LHHIPGRVRLRVPQLKQEPALAPLLRQEFQALAAVVEVDVRPASGSVLLHYQPTDASDEETLAALLAPAVRLASPPTTPPRSTPDASVGDAAAEWIYTSWAQLDATLRRATSGALDLREVIPLLFVALGVRHILLEARWTALPWYVAFQYAVFTFDHYYGRSSRASQSDESPQSASGPDD
jgi:hypothetical protein